MTNMKRTLSAIAAMAMLAASIGTMNAFAAEADDEFKKVGGENEANYTETDIDVTADADVQGSVGIALYGADADAVEQNIELISGSKSDPKIYVEVEWEELKFVYDFGKITAYEWNLDTIDYDEVREYVNKEGPDWIDNDAKIKFTNYSNRDVWTGVSFEKNPETEVYKDVNVTFDKYEVLLPTAVCTEELPYEILTMTVDGAPLDCIDKNDVPALGSLKFYISEEARVTVIEQPAEEEEEEENGEHVCHFVYDQFGRLVCTGCNKVKHEYCIDEDEDGLCDECGLDRDFCPDCHIGGTCRCT